MTRVWKKHISLSAVSAVSILALLSPQLLFAQQSAVTAVRNPIADVDVQQYLDKIILPKGFQIALFAENVPGARSLARGANGSIFVGTRGKRGNKARGSIFAVIDKNNDHYAEQVIEIHDDLFMPNGVAFRDGSLYVAEPNRMLRYDQIESNLDTLPEPVVINDSYPSDTHHGWKYIKFGPDDRLYVPVGAPCNICEPSDQYSVMTSIKADGSDKRTIASGIRNTVGFDWHPISKELWFTENGRDLWGDDQPPEELNRISQDGQHFGYPYVYGKDLKDDEFETPDLRFTPAALELAPHTAPLGMKFYTGKQFPEQYHHQILIPHHGSWNRSVPDGFYISLVTLKDGKVQKPSLFASGWLQGDEFWGRPTDLLIMPDGSVLVSDDHAGAIYRISYTQELNKGQSNDD